MEERIRLDTRRLSASDDDVIRLAVIDSIRHWRRKRFFYNEEDRTFPTVIGQDKYTRAPTPASTVGYPFDLLSLETLWYPQGSTEQEVFPEKHKVIREMFVTGARGFPSLYAWHDETIYLDYEPHAVFNLRAIYVKDLGTPTYSFDGNAWTFLHPDGTSLSGTYSTAWFTDGEALVRLYAEFLIYSVFLKDQEEAGTLVAPLGEALKSLKTESDARRRSSRPVTPFL